MDAAAADNGGGKSEDDTATPACEEAPPADPEPLADPPSPPPHAAPRKAVVDMAEDFSEEAVAVTTLRIPVDTAGQPVSAVPFPAWSLPLGPAVKFSLGKNESKGEDKWLQEPLNSWAMPDVDGVCGQGGGKGGV